MAEDPGGQPSLGAIGSGPGVTLVRYNLLFLFSYSLAFTGAYLLAREVGLDWGGAAVAGAAFAFCPWRLSQTDHLNILSTGGIPLTFFFLIRGWRTRRGALVLAGWVVATWQGSPGFGVGLEFACA